MTLMIASRPRSSLHGLAVVFGLIQASCGGLLADDSSQRLGGGTGAAAPGSGGSAGASQGGASAAEGGTAGSTSQTAPPWSRTCGNGLLEPGEACDDANQIAGDGCSSTCCVEATESICYERWCSLHARPCHCGDGFVEATEQCDDGNLKFGDGCSAYCEWEDGLCGNAHLEGKEECDDGNLLAKDGCDPACYKEKAGMGAS